MLRKYQEECISKMLWSRKLEGGCIISLPTASGKSHIIAEFVHRLKEPVLIFVPSRELLEQDLEKLSNLIPREEIGVYSASMKEKTVKQFTLATIQSAYRNPELFKGFDVAIIDELHLYSTKNQEGMYNKLFREIGIKKLYGLSATPYRNDHFYKATGKYWAPWETIHTIKMCQRTKPFVWNRMIYVINTQELMPKYLTPPTYYDMKLLDHNQIPTNKSLSDFDMKAFDELTKGSLPEVAKFIHGIKHNKTIVFCSSVEQAQALQSLVGLGNVVTGTTPAKERKTTVKEFKELSTGLIFNVGVLLTGFNAPDLDCIVCLRPTRSILLWQQMLGRGMRKFEGKTTCHVYDFVSNTANLGRAETIEIKKIDGKWNVTTEVHPYGLHMKPLFSFLIKRRTME